MSYASSSFSAAFRLSIAHIDHAVLIKIAPRHVRKALRTVTPTPAVNRSIDALHANLDTIAVDTLLNTDSYLRDHQNNGINPEDFSAYQLNLHTSLSLSEEAQLEAAFNPDPDADFQTSTGSLDELFPEFDNSDIDALEKMVQLATSQATAYQFQAV